MKLLRFIDSEELDMLMNGQEVTPVFSYEGYNTTLGGEDVVFCFDLNGRTSHYIKRSGYQPLNSGIVTTQDKIIFYAGLATGIIAEDYAVIIDKDISEVKLGKGTYADPRYIFSEEPLKHDDYEVEIVEVGIPSYTIDDVLEIWEEDWPVYKKIK